MGNLSITRGDDVTLDFTVTTGGVAVDLTGATLQFLVKTLPTDTDANAIFTKTVGSGITVTDATAGIGEIAFTQANTISLSGGTRYYAFTMKKSSVVTTLDQGAFIILNNVRTSSL